MRAGDRLFLIAAVTGAIAIVVYFAATDPADYLYFLAWLLPFVVLGLLIWAAYAIIRAGVRSGIESARPPIIQPAKATASPNWQWNEQSKKWEDPTISQSSLDRIKERKDAVPVESSETCQNCNRVIGKLETPSVWKDKVVCKACYHILAD